MDFIKLLKDVFFVNEGEHVKFSFKQEEDKVIITDNRTGSFVSYGISSNQYQKIKELMGEDLTQIRDIKLNVPYLINYRVDNKYQQPDLLLGKNDVTKETKSLEKPKLIETDVRSAPQFYPYNAKAQWSQIKEQPKVISYSSEDINIQTIIEKLVADGFIESRLVGNESEYLFPYGRVDGDVPDLTVLKALVKQTMVKMEKSRIITLEFLKNKHDNVRLTFSHQDLTRFIKTVVRELCDSGLATSETVYGDYVTQ